MYLSMQGPKVIKLLVLVFAVGSVLVGCDEPAKTSAAGGNASGEQYTQEYQEELLGRARAGDWKAARDLGVHRFVDLGKTDRLTLSLLEQWAAHDPNGLGLLTQLLYLSCDKSDRLKAIALLKTYVPRGGKFANKYAMASHREIIATWERNVDSALPDCVPL